MTELLDDPLYTLDPSAETAPWCADSISALRNRLRKGGRPYRVIVDHERRSRVTLVDTFDWRVLDSGRVAVLLGDELLQPTILHHTYRRDRSREEDESVALEASVPVPAPIAPAAPICDCVAPRALLKMGCGEVSFRRGRLVNSAGKTEAILDEIAVDGTAAGSNERPQRFLLRRPLRGYHRIVSIPLGTPVGVEGVVDALAAGAGRQPFDFDTRLNLPIRSDDDPQAAHRHVVSRLVGTMAAVRPGIGGVGDPEFLHDYRVALRRLRSYLKEAGLGPPSSAPPPPAQTRHAVALLDEIWEATGVARDFDVFLERRNHYLSAAPAPLHDEVEHLFDRIAGLREESYAVLLRCLPVGYEAELEIELLARGPGWGPGFEWSSKTHLDAQATRWVHKREKKFLKLVARLQDAYALAGDDIDDEKIHASRKAAKKYRYLHEIFLPVLDEGKYSSKRVKQLRKLQNLLGSYNDLVVEESRFHEILTRRDTGSYGDARAATAYMLAQVEREKDAARKRVLKELSREVQ